MNHHLAVLLALGFVAASCATYTDEIRGGPTIEDDDVGDDDDDDAGNDDDDDDITGDDDSAPDDDGGGDDDTLPYDPAGCGDDDAAFSQEIGPIQLTSHRAYTLYLIGDGVGPAQVMFLDVGETDPNGSLPRFRFIHGAASAPTLDVYHEGNLYSSMEHIELGTVTPSDQPFNYWQMSWAGDHTHEVFAAGQGPPNDTALAPAVSMQMLADTMYSGVLTCGTGDYKLQIYADDIEPPAGGVARLGLFHSVDGIGPVDVTIVEPTSGPLWSGVQHGTLATPTELSWGTYVLEVESQAK